MSPSRIRRARSARLKNVEPRSASSWARWCWRRRSLSSASTSFWRRIFSARSPEIARRAVYVDLWAVLRGEDRSGHFDHLSAEDRQAILEILEETKPEFAELRAWAARGPTAAAR